MSKSLVAYFTHSGNTQSVAKIIGQEMEAKLFEIQPIAAYPGPYRAVVAQAKRELQMDFLPPIHPLNEGIEAFDTIFIGTPNWWSSVAPPVSSFLSQYDVAAKRIVPFCTHGGGGLGHIMRDVQKRCPQSEISPCLSLYGDGGAGARQAVRAWLQEIGLQQGR